MDHARLSNDRKVIAVAAINRPQGRRTLAPIVFAFGLSLTVVWVVFLGYELLSLIIPLLPFSMVG